MQINTLGRSDLQVSRICLGSMTWGTQNSQEDAHAQIDYATDHGVNFLDTAELYPSAPLSAETAGNTERIIGNWIAASGRRSDIVLASKIVGSGNRTVRPEGGPISPTTIRAAVEGSLERLQTDYIDLYQLHWPNRGSYHFRQNWKFDATIQPKPQRQEFLAVLEELGNLVAEGKIRHVGLSNESAWGTALWLELSQSHGLPRMVSIQNEYSLLHRIFDLDLAELCHHEDVGLMAYSPLGAGMLSGKYEENQIPAGSRLSIDSMLGGRWNSYSVPVVSKYVSLARDHGLEPAKMALAFCLGRPFMQSVIIGATTMDQLKSNLSASELTLSDEVMQGISEIHRAHPIPL